MESGKPTLIDYLAIAFCTLVWGTTWYAITLQFGEVDPAVSVVYRFGLAAAVLFAWRLVRGEPIFVLSPTQHLSALCVGLFIYCSNYVLVYWSETHIASAVTAVIFASLAFANIVVFRFTFRERATAAAWIASALGIVGVAVLSWGEIARAQLGAHAVQGVTYAFLAVVCAAIGNAFAHRKDYAAIPLTAGTAWGMLYGAVALAIFVTLSGREWTFSATPAYVGSLLYLSLAGSVGAFLFYFALARRRGFVLAAYTSALTPPIAMLMSTLFEEKTWGVTALAGVALVLSGQWLLLRTKKAG